MGLREPTRLMAKLAARLFESAAEQEAFLHALTHPGERLQGVIWVRSDGDSSLSPSSGGGGGRLVSRRDAEDGETNSSPCLQGEVASERSEDDGGGNGPDSQNRPPSPSLHSGTPPCKQGGELGEFPSSGEGKELAPPLWLPTWAEVRSTKERLGQTPEHERGDIYLLDASSLFTASCLLAIPEAKSALDLCASPGGKAIYGYRHLSPERFVCNEVIGKRHAALISNLRRCGIPAEVTQRDAKDIDEMFDAVWVDAPCSGQSLLAMGKDAHGAFHPNIINMNANRQKRILANAAQWVNAGGWLAYMTCTFSPDENEGVIQWFLARNPEWQIVPVPHLATHAKEVGYQLYPHQGHGAGGYCCLLRAPF